jgi:UDP-N-acetylmuramoyl-tripeptide--D-alanyl-D-alanine ligase
LSMPGKHAVSNALASAAVGLAFDVSAENIERSLGKFQGFSKRMEILHAGGVTIVNDTYNANPDSVTMALETVQAMKCGGKKIIILADMLELGAASRREHEQIGELIGRIGFEYLLTFGEMAAFISEHTKAKVNVHYDQKNVLSEYAAELVSDGDCVLVKGSRGMHMEDVVTFLVERLKVKDVLETNNQ